MTELLGIKQRRALEILVKMVEKRWLNKEDASRSTVYVINKESNDYWCIGKADLYRKK